MLSANVSEQPGRETREAVISVDVPYELARLRAERAYELEGHAGRTLTKKPELRVVLEAVKEGVRLPIHGTAEQLTLQVLLGQLRVRLPFGDQRELAEGSFVAIDAGLVHEIEALHDSAFLLTLAWPPAERREAGDEEEYEGAGI